MFQAASASTVTSMLSLLPSLFSHPGPFCSTQPSQAPRSVRKASSVPLLPSHLLCPITAWSRVRFLGLLQHSAQNWDPKPTQFYSPTALEATRVQLGCRRSLKAPGKDRRPLPGFWHCQPSSGFLGLWLHHTGLCLCHQVPSSLVSLFVSPYKRTSVQGVGSNLHLHGLLLTQLPPPKTSLPNKCTFTVP